MTTISPQLLQSIIIVLLEDDSCDDLLTLRDLFRDIRLQTWRNRLLGLENRSTQDRVSLIVNYLRSKQNTQGANGLSLFLQVLIERTPANDSHYQKLEDLLAKLDAENISPRGFTAMAGDSVQKSSHKLHFHSEPIIVEIYPLSIKLVHEGGNWFVELRNRGQQSLRKVTLIFRLQSHMFIRPQTLIFKTIEALSTSQTRKVHIDIDEIKMRDSSVYSLGFEVVYLESGKRIRCESKFDIPMANE